MGCLFRIFATGKLIRKTFEGDRYTKPSHHAVLSEHHQNSFRAYLVLLHFAEILFFTNGRPSTSDKITTC